MINFKKVLCVTKLLMAMSVPIITVSVLPTQIQAASTIRGKVTGNGVRVRSSTSTKNDKNVIGQLYKGDTVKVYPNKTKGNFYYIYSSDLGEKGYISQDYVEIGGSTVMP